MAGNHRGRVLPPTPPSQKAHPPDLRRPARLKVMQIDLKPCGAQRGSNYFMASGYRRPGGFKGRGKTEWNFSYDGQSFDSDRWEDLKTHQPFYPRINLKETHRKFQAPKRANPVIVPPHYP